MKKFWASVFIIVGISLVCVSPVAAHQYETNGTIGALLHVVPNDQPVSDVATKLVLTFSDTSHEFNLKDCYCTIKVSYNGKSFLNQTLAAGTGLKTDVPVTFPSAGKGYLITVTGRPASGATFDSFAFEYDDVSVLQGPHRWTPIQVVGVMAGITLFVIMLIGVFFWLRSLDKSDTEK